MRVKFRPTIQLRCAEMERGKPSEPVIKIKLGDKVIRRTIERQKRLRIVPRTPAIFRGLKVVVTQTPVLWMLLVLVVLLLIFSAGIYFSDRNASGTSITSYGAAVY